MIITKNKKTVNAGTGAVKQLRINDLQKGIPFMINSKDLPPRQCYMEYPDGIIKLVTIPEGTREFITLKVLSKIECKQLRQKFDLSNYA